uniref:Uncharacterized protein n=1 Tax=Trichuris muris TaxID=70415 RepID=A0A5S6QD04_TRIMR
MSWGAQDQPVTPGVSSAAMVNFGQGRPTLAKSTWIFRGGRWALAKLDVRTAYILQVDTLSRLQGRRRYIFTACILQLGRSHSAHDWDGQF